MEKYKKFIEKAYNGKLGLTMCKDWKEKIEKEFPEMRESYKAGDWVWLKSPYFLYGEKMLIYFKGFDSDSYTFGFGVEKEWIESFRLPVRNTVLKITKATDKDVTDALIAEAKKRGFKEGVTIIPVGCNNPQKITNPFGRVDIDKINTYSPMSEWHNNYSNPPIYRNGLWASIVEKQTELTLEQIAEKFNIKVGDLRIKGVSGETESPFMVGDVVMVKDNNNDLYGTRLVVKKVLRLFKTIAVGSWSSDTITGHFYEHELKLAN